jgi:hypothetical protein
MPIPLLPAVIAAFTLANGAHYWHQQLKPFKTSQEQTQAIKEELAESPFVGHWNENDKRSLVKNPDFLNIETWWPDNYSIRKNQNDPRHYKFLIGWDSLLFTAKNRRAIKAECKNIALDLGHEGAHIAQGFDSIFQTFHKLPDDQKPQFMKAIEIDADQKGLEATLSASLTFQEKLHALMHAKHRRSDKCFQKHTQKHTQQLLCENHTTHPPCSERIALIENFIQQLKELKPHIRMEIINETVREEIAWQ